MDAKTLKNISNEIARRFPEVTGCAPSVHSKPNDQVMIIFQGRGRTADGRVISRTVRVLAQQNGAIQKITTSR